MSDQNHVPAFTLKIGGSVLERADLDMVQSITVDLRRQAPASAIIQFNNQSNQFDDHGSIKLGADVVVELGFEDGGKALVFTGKIVGVQARVEGDAPQLFLVHAFDKLHGLSRGRKTKTFLDQKFSDIVGGIVQGGGLSADAEDTAFVREYVIQHNQTDLEFIRGIAGWLDYDLRIAHHEDGNKLCFRKPKLDGAAAVTATYEAPRNSGSGGASESELRRFHGQQSVARVATEVTVRGWNPKEKKEIVSTVSRLDHTMGGDKSAVDVAKTVGAAPHHQLVDYKVFTQQEADSIAKAKIHEYGRTLIRADIELWGNPKVFAGGIIEVKNVGKHFDGMYFVESVTHLFRSKVNVEGGYTTRVVASRCGW